MAFQLSPGVEVKEIDLTNVIPAVATNIGGFAGAFSWGPIEELISVESERDLLRKFGRPALENNLSFFTAASFLKYASNLKISRAFDSQTKNSASSFLGEE